MTKTLDAARSLLLVVDMQARLHPAIAGGAEALAEAIRLCRMAALLGVPVWATEHCPEAIGPLLPELAPLVQRRVRKTSFDACGEAGFLDALPANRDRIVVCGYEAHVCVLQTSLGLLAAGRRVALVRDAVGSRTRASRKAALGRLASQGVDLVTAEMVGFEWLRDAADPRFRDLLRLVK